MSTSHNGSETSLPSGDATVVGAGLAGLAAASVLDQAGFRVTLVDQRRVQPAIFKAEKLEPDQIGLMKEFGLLENALPVCESIQTLANGYRGRLLRVFDRMQYGYHYHDLVNALRQSLRRSIRFEEGRVSAFQSAADRQTVFLTDGRRISSRLLVLACGTTRKLLHDVGLARSMIRSGHSVCIGFTARRLPLPGGADSLTYFRQVPRLGIDYITLFPVPDGLRANMFAYWPARDERIRYLMEGGARALDEWMPGLNRMIGSLDITSKIEARPIDLYRVEDPARDGLVLLGDAFQSVCPATGTGLSKVLNDVKALKTHAPRWLEAPAISRATVQAYYSDPGKVASDEHSLGAAEYRRRFGTERSVAAEIHRQLEYFRMWKDGRSTAVMGGTD